ncbi:unnamed protein product [Arabis nemorensis]|uniref:Uncharacterized protein n=1 Tax=Arabis nemorensis TaxID=586526 RepID=A0A565C534_9BRAS|nr:unnamed protein product [Arabis nemorensis]
MERVLTEHILHDKDRVPPIDKKILHKARHKRLAAGHQPPSKRQRAQKTKKMLAQHASNGEKDESLRIFDDDPYH